MKKTIIKHKTLRSEKLHHTRSIGGYCYNLRRRRERKKRNRTMINRIKKNEQ